MSDNYTCVNDFCDDAVSGDIRCIHCLQPICNECSTDYSGYCESCYFCIGPDYTDESWNDLAGQDDSYGGCDLTETGRDWFYDFERRMDLMS
jgi:hypothetical protein